MKRDMEKVRGVMLALEEDDGPFLLTMDADPIGGTENAQEIAEYILLLESAGYLDRTGRSTFRMAWAGHEFLDSVRDPEIWRKTKEGAGKVGSWSVKMLGELAIGYARAKAVELGLPIAG